MPARHRLGNLHLQILSDGLYFQDAGAVFGIVPKVMWERLGVPLNDRHQMSLGLNSLLLQSQGKTILIETGVGDKERPLAQTERPGGVSLLDELSAIGVAVEDIDIVINTHLHADHCGWNTRKDADGAYVPTYPRARLPAGSAPAAPTCRSSASVMCPLARLPPRRSPSSRTGAARSTAAARPGA